MANYTINYTGKTYNVRGDRPLNGGVDGSSFTGLNTDIVAELNALSPLALSSAVGLNPTGTTVALANGNTKTVPLSTAAQPYTLYRTTGDTTISGAVLNFPTTGLVDGSTVSFVCTGAVTTLTGTVATGSLPTVSAITSGKKYNFVYNLAATQWFEI